MGATEKFPLTHQMTAKCHFLAIVELPSFLIKVTTRRNSREIVSKRRGHFGFYNDDSNSLLPDVSYVSPRLVNRAINTTSSA